MGPAQGVGTLIGTDNPLPYWTGPTQASGNAVSCEWVENSAAPSGHVLRFTFGPGSAFDEAYVEQTVPIGGSRSAVIGHIARASYLASGGYTGTLSFTVAVAYLDADGDVVGSEETALGANPASGDVDQTHQEIPTVSVTTDLTDVASLRIRLTVNRTGAVGTPVLDVADVRLDAGHPYIVIPDLLARTANWRPSHLVQSGGVVEIRPQGALTGKLSISSSYTGASGVPLRLAEIAAPSTPSSGGYYTYAKSDGHAYGKNDAGAEFGLGIQRGSGSPEGVVTGSVADLYVDTAGGVGTTLYVKESGDGTNTGWAAK